MIAVLKRLEPIWLCLYVFALGTSMSGMELFSSLLILTMLLKLYWERPRRATWFFPPFLIPLVSFVGVIWLGIALGDASTKDKLYDAQRVRFFLIYIFLFYSLRRAVNETSWLHLKSNSIFKTILVMCCFTAVYGTIQHFIPLDLFRPEGKKVLLYAIQDEKIGPLVVGTFNHHLTFSNIYLYYACLLCALGLSFWPQKFWVLVLGLWMYLLCIWTQSRAAWVAIPFTLFIVGATRGRKTMFLAFNLALVAMIFFYFTDRGFSERLNRTLIQSEEHYNLGARTRLWKAQIEMFKERPWIGVGYNNNERKAKEFVDRLYPNRKDNFYGHAHSNFLQVLASTGLLGTACFLWLWCAVFVCNVRFIMGSANRLEKSLGIGILAGFIGFHIQGITQWNFGDAEVLHNVMFFWALLAALSFKEK